jgi:transglutaminase-like putative cysteine protease
MPKLQIRHVTQYRYRNPVALGEHRIMFRPLESYDQRVLSSNVVIAPEPIRLRYIHDVFGNCVGVAHFAAKTRDLVFDNDVVLDHRPLPPFADDGEGERYSQTIPFAYSAEDMPDLARSIERFYPDPENVLERWARGFVRSDGRTRLQSLLTEMTQAIHCDFRYATRLRGQAQAPLETLHLRTGTCRDFAVLMMEAARSLGMAAQFVSGYIRTSAPTDGRSAGLGGGHTHAWTRVFLPAHGWIEFDPTNGIVGNADLVRVAIARDPRQALPLHGTWSGLPGDFLGMDVSVDVTGAAGRVA